MIEGIIISILFVAAVFYVSKTIYKSYKGESGCSDNCGCDFPVHQMKEMAKPKQ